MSHFWRNQPIGNQAADGTRSTPPARLPRELHWCTFDVQSADSQAQLEELLDNNYVTSPAREVRLLYSKELLQWMLRWPATDPTWRVGIRFDEQLVGFIAAAPCLLNYRGEIRRSVSVNLLCVHREWRNLGLAPALIEELTRRVMRKGVSSAIFTTGHTLPVRPVASTRYYCRPLNISRLRQIGYIDNSFTIKPIEPVVTGLDGFEPLRAREASAAHRLLQRHLDSYALHPIVTTQEFMHWFKAAQSTASPFRIYSWNENGNSKALLSYYIYEQCFTGPDESHVLRCAALYYWATQSSAAQQMINKALFCASHRDRCDLFFALPLMTLSKDLLVRSGFALTDGTVSFFIYNWDYREHSPSEIAVCPV